jgi:hypothetical protein
MLGSGQHPQGGRQKDSREAGEEINVRELRLWTAAAAAPATAAGFYALAVLRRRRSLHPTGVGYQGQLVVGDGPGRPSVSLLRPGSAYPALLRFSRGAGLPEPLPDALGVAIKLPNVHGPGADQDLLLTSSTSRPLLRRLLFPARGFVRGAFSTALPYDLDGERVVVLLVPVPPRNGRSPRGVTAAAAPWPSCVPPPLPDLASSFGPRVPWAPHSGWPP